MILRTLLPVAVLSALLCSCAATSGSERLSIGDIRSELDRRGCIIRMDDLAFELETGIYHGRYTLEEADSVISSMPDSLVCCPGTSSRYIIETSGEPVLVCPLGHGTVHLII
jgi:hypothetical protein